MTYIKSMVDKNYEKAKAKLYKRLVKICPV